MNTSKNLSAYMIIYGLLGPIVGACMVWLYFSRNSGFPHSFNDLYLAIQQLVICIIFSYIVSTIPATLTGILAAFVPLKGIKNYLVTALIGGLSLCLTSLLLTRCIIDLTPSKTVWFNSIFGAATAFILAYFSSKFRFLKNYLSTAA